MRKEGGREGRKRGMRRRKGEREKKKYVDRFQRTRCVKREKKITSEN